MFLSEEQYFAEVVYMKSARIWQNNPKQDPEALKSSDPKIQTPRNPEIQRARDPETQRPRGPATQRHGDPETPIVPLNQRLS